jgi:hypothetical protein
MIADLLFVNAYSWETVLGMAVAGFACGFLIKSALIFKQRKRILRLEDEMLANHSRILALEKKISESKSEINGVHQDYNISSQRSSERGMRAS